MSNYPDGTGPNDPKAPWNEKEPRMTEWEECGMETCKWCGQVELCNDKDECKYCFDPEEIEE